MKETYSYTFNTRELNRLFNIDGEKTLSETFTGTKWGEHFPGMLGQKHSEKTKRKMSESALGKNKPHLHKGGKIIKDGEVYEYTCLSHASKELNLSTSHLSEVMSGKRQTVKGWSRCG